MVDAYYFCVGGSVGQFASIARPVGYRCAASDVPDAIERLLVGYDECREQGENLRRFLARHSNEDIREILAGSYITPVERDLTLGQVPQTVEG
jgi:sulfite reductase (ferredoxin)